MNRNKSTGSLLPIYNFAKNKQELCIILENNGAHIKYYSTASNQILNFWFNNIVDITGELPS